MEVEIHHHEKHELHERRKSEETEGTESEGDTEDTEFGGEFLGEVNDFEGSRDKAR